MMAMDADPPATIPGNTRRRRRWPVVLVAVAAALILGTVQFPPTTARSPEVGPPSALGQSPAADPPLALDAGASHTCVLTSTGVARCWGGNDAGQVGNGSTTSGIRRPWEVIESASGNRSISAGEAGSCVVTSSGGVRCWGIRGSSSNGPGAVDVAGAASRIGAVSVGGAHQCAVTRSGGVTCWGDNTDGQLGDGTTTARPAPVTANGLPGPVTVVSSGAAHTCALTRAGGVVCWGDNGEGQLGNRGRKESASPVAVKGLSSGVTAISAGEYHTCAITDTGGVTCWGAGQRGQLGGRSVMNSRVPVGVIGLGRGAVAVSAGGGHTCAIMSVGAVRCWGGNAEGQLGDGTTVSSVVPVDVKGLPAGVSAIALGGRHTCAATADGVTCWGANDSGQLGDGSRRDSDVPVAVAPPQAPAVVTDTRPINLIYLDTGFDLTTGQPAGARKARQVMGARLRAQDRALLEAIRQGFVGATGGRLNPANARVTVAPRLLRLGERCVDHEYGGNTQDVEDAARPHRVKGAINVVVVEAFSCADNDGQTWGGYDWTGLTPVALWSSLDSVNDLMHTVLHEWGHDAGLNHAGMATCEDPVAIARCDVQPTDDETSLMSYAHGVDRFTEPELDALRLLPREEVVRVTPGQALPLRIVLHDALEPGPKLLILKGARHKKPVFVSWLDGNLQVRSRLKAKDFEPVLAGVWRDTPILGERVFGNTALTVTFVGTDDRGRAILDILPRPSRSRTPTSAPAKP